MSEAFETTVLDVIQLVGMGIDPGIVEGSTTDVYIGKFLGLTLSAMVELGDLLDAISSLPDDIRLTVLTVIAAYRTDK